MIEIKRKGQAAAEKAAERTQSAVEGLDAQARGQHATTPSTEPVLKREIRPFTGIDKTRDYRAMYRAVFSFHETHNPPQVDSEYWKTHKPGIDETPQAEMDYWEQTTKDISSVCKDLNNDSFFIGLISEVYNELRREYEAARQRTTD